MLDTQDEVVQTNVFVGPGENWNRRVLPDEREDLERLAQYIIRNPFAVEKMQVSRTAGCADAGRTKRG